MRVDGTIIGPDAEVFWEVTQDNLQETVDRLQSDGATLVMVETDRIGVGVYGACTPEDCHPFLDRLARHDEYRQRWNAMVRAFAANNDRVRIIAVDDLYCTDDAVPCNDEHDGVLARGDGSHFSDAVLMPGIAEAVIDRIIAATNG